MRRDPDKTVTDACQKYEMNCHFNSRLVSGFAAVFDLTSGQASIKSAMHQHSNTKLSTATNNSFRLANDASNTYFRCRDFNRLPFL